MNIIWPQTGRTTISSLSDSNQYVEISISEQVTTGGAISDTKIKILSFALGLAEHLPLDVWLLAGHGWSLPKNRITTYKKFWRSMSSIGIEKPISNFGDFVANRSTEGIQFCGYRRITTSEASLVERLSARLPCLLVYSPSEEIIAKLLEAGYPTFKGGINQVLERRIRERGLPYARFAEDSDEFTVRLAMKIPRCEMESFTRLVRLSMPD